jgi:3-deoxy-7-phosphoheptulonate synthase
VSDLRLIGRADGDAREHGFAVNGVHVGGGSFHVVAGLCVVDNRENLDATLSALAQNGVTTTRAGVWKPRTSPYHFQGLGKDCLPWLFESCGKHGIKLVAIEVLSPSHIDDIARALDDAGRTTSVMLQIGTRNAQNFELLKAVGAQRDMPVLYKRGMGIRLDESLLAAEYIAAAGNERVVFCLRGVHTHLGEPHRNLVDFALLPVVKRKTRLPVCVDPSHSVGGKGIAPDGRTDVHHAAAMGVIAGADLLLVDVHPKPSEALCDGPQALTLDELPRFLEDTAAVRAAYNSRPSPAPTADLGEVRARLDDVDNSILALLARRAELGREASRHKRAAGLPVRDEVRESATRAKREQFARAHGLDEAFIDEVFEKIVTWSRAMQERERG